MSSWLGSQRHDRLIHAARRDRIRPGAAQASPPAVTALPAMARSTCQ